MRIGKRKKKATAILTADWHLRRTRPRCRTDDYGAAQWGKVAIIRELQKEKGNIPVLHAGDLFHVARSSLSVVNLALQRLPERMWCVPGQHDLPEHSLEQFDDSAMANLKYAGRVMADNFVNAFETPDHFNVVFFPYGSKLRECWLGGRKNIALIHTLVQAPSGDGFKHAEDASRIFDRLKSFQLIVCGDNHTPFTVRDRRSGQLLVSPGSLMRMSADQADHRPRVYLWYGDTNEVEPVYLPIEEGVVDRSHIDEKEEHDGRMEEYKRKLRRGIEADISFEGNMKKYLHKNRVKPKVERTIYSAMQLDDFIKKGREHD